MTQRTLAMKALSVLRTAAASAAALAMALGLVSCGPSGVATRGEAPPLDPIMGDWQGNHVSSDGRVTPVAVRVIALGGSTYRFNVQPAFDQRLDDRTMLAEGRLEGDHVVPLGEGGWDMTLDNGELTGHTTRTDAQNFTLRHLVRLSPNLGAKPPQGAIHLFDGTGLAAWERRDEKQRTSPVGWKLIEGSAMEVVPGTGDIITKQKFSDFRLHVEFRLPFMPAAREQARANSGVYLQGRYEIQVLDSYGLKGEDNECGGIYKVAAPLVNMCAPPGQWQTYDVTYHAPRFDAEGKKLKDALVTVVHNGVVIHRDLSVPGPTGGAIDDDVKAPGGLMLQDHGNLVQYRNIWLVELKD
jgi:hypothetical protein